MSIIGKKVKVADNPPEDFTCFAKKGQTGLAIDEVGTTGRRKYNTLMVELDDGHVQFIPIQCLRYMNNKQVNV